MYLNTYDIIFLFITVSGLFTLGAYDYRKKIRSQNFMSSFQKHYQDQINECQAKHTFFSAKNSSPAKRQWLSIVLTYFLIFCLGAIPFWISIAWFSRQDPWFKQFYHLSDQLFSYFMSWGFMFIAVRVLRIKPYPHSTSVFSLLSQRSPFSSTLQHHDSESLYNFNRGFKFKVQHPVLGYWRLLKKLHRVS